MKRIVLATLAAGLVALSAPGWAENRVFEGTIPSSRGVVRLPLTLSTDLKDVVLCGNYWRLNLTDDMPLSQLPPSIPQVPEPATFALWAAGLALLAGRARSALGHARQVLRIARALHLDVRRGPVDAGQVVRP